MCDLIEPDADATERSVQGGKMDFGLKGAAVCISGGTKGLGREAALAFAREGARVAVAGRSRHAIDDTVLQLLDAGSPDAFGIEVDLQVPATIEVFFSAIEARWGMLNTLINMAGPSEPSGGMDFTQVADDRWQYYFDVGIMGAVRCTRAAVPLLRKAEWGRVINISSISARIVIPSDAPYQTAKGGLNAFTKSLAWTLAPEGILVNTVTPGVFRTEGTRTWMEMSGATDRYDPENVSDIWTWMRDVNGGRHGGIVGRVGMPAELGPLLLLLGSRANTYIAGANIAIDGGTDFSAG
jgi:NAD(P)-dependent dehydrogenase (short-subunit alcohol dehydrogenase family)